MLRNQVTLVGRLGSDATITTFENGSMVARFQFAVEGEKKNADSEKGLFYRMFAWGNTASFLTSYCQKGSKLAVSGRLVNRTYIDKEGFAKRVTEVEVRQVVKF
ncbi:single-stranded DNA-binding protein [Fluviicola taffensis]|uniref:Single-stranded DNA-binding protein n=1 Tax=Fluviicola taffensis (strain DSM 16823 / NCIMB 13979 / RW262) TaxID=755732 RepID=F2IIU7_FLUTR|nr:single-stranded DNA-binding protein [Fluviicola taffensis]AEA42804.1 single-strand binding protein/Primosomal replication protein n [Fluviicola taffensis DSM 16823]